nr:sporulation protein YqfD [Sedimentibacter sp.]
MITFKLWNLIRGYVIINITETNYEKTINVLQRNKIRLWDIEKKEVGVSFKISNEDYKKYHKIIKESKLETAGKTGLSFKIKKLKLRKGFIAGIIILVLCFFMFTNLVWNIEVIGVNHAISSEIKNALSENGIKMPSTIAGLNEKHIETILHKKFANFKFVEAYIEGSKLIIFVKEKESESSVIKENVPSSIISTKNAIINKAIVKNGQLVVQVGDVVYKGQTLVMGIVKNKNSDDFMMVPSEGTIYGKTYYNFEMKEFKKKDIAKYTNNAKKIYYLKKNEDRYKIIGDTEPFENYNYSERTIKIPIFSNITGISLVKGKFFEETIDEVDIDENTAKNKMKVNLYDDLIKMCGSDAKILNTSFDFQEDENCYYLNAQIEVIEDIGEKIRIFPTEENEENDNNEEIKED